MPLSTNQFYEAYDHGHTGWEYAGKLCVFGGRGPSPEGYLNDYGDIAGDFLMKLNNQLLCYNPNSKRWTNPQCFGATPTDPLRLCNFNPSDTSCHHDRRSTTAQQPLEQYVL